MLSGDLAIHAISSSQYASLQHITSSESCFASLWLQKVQASCWAHTGLALLGKYSLNIGWGTALIYQKRGPSPLTERFSKIDGILRILIVQEVI